MSTFFGFVILGAGRRDITIWAKDSLEHWVYHLISRHHVIPLRLRRERLGVDLLRIEGLGVFWKELRVLGECGGLGVVGIVGIVWLHFIF